MQDVQSAIDALEQTAPRAATHDWRGVSNPHPGWGGLGIAWSGSPWTSVDAEIENFVTAIYEHPNAGEPTLYLLLQLPRTLDISRQRVLHNSAPLPNAFTEWAPFTGTVTNATGTDDYYVLEITNSDVQFGIGMAQGDTLTLQEDHGTPASIWIPDDSITPSMLDADDAADKGAFQTRIESGSIGNDREGIFELSSNTDNDIADTLRLTERNSSIITEGVKYYISGGDAGGLRGKVIRRNGTALPGGVNEAAFRANFSTYWETILGGALLNDSVNPEHLNADSTQQKLAFRQRIGVTGSGASISDDEIPPAWLQADSAEQKTAFRTRIGARAEPATIELIQGWSGDAAATDRDEEITITVPLGELFRLRMSRADRMHYRYIQMPTNGHVLLSAIGESGETVDNWVQASDSNIAVLGPLSNNGRDPETFNMVIEAA